jgi:predicted patatin/cPLA2 family phospholipase
MLNTIAGAKKAHSKQVSLLLKSNKTNPFSAFIISPDKMPPAKSITRNGDKINQTLDLGYEKVEKLSSRLGKFLQLPPS